MTACLLSQPTLVLNQSWVAIDTTPVRNALCLLFKGTALAVQPDTYEVHCFDSWSDLRVGPHEPQVQTVRFGIRIPEVITLTRYNRVPLKSVSFSRRNLFRRDEHTCQYCGVQPGVGDLTIDHVLPRSRGGKTSWTNCVLACSACNIRKANRTPSQARMTLRCRPGPPKRRPAMGVPTGQIRDSWAKFVGTSHRNGRPG